MTHQPIFRWQAGCRRLHRMAWVSATLLAGCSSYSPVGLQPGSTVAQVVAAMGPPTASWEAPRRLEFARGPMGLHTYMVDFDAEGKMASWTQVLTENNFFQVQRGQTESEVLLRLGHPASVFTIPRQHIAVWNYRYEGPFCQRFQVSIGTAPDTRGRVTDASFGPDPMCTSSHSLD